MRCFCFQLSDDEIADFQNMAAGMLAATTVPSCIYEVASWRCVGMVPQNVIKDRDRWVARYERMLAAKYPDMVSKL